MVTTDLVQAPLRPGDAVTFDDRDDLLEKLDRLNRPVPARHEGRSKDDREHACMLAYLRFIGTASLLPLPVTLRKTPANQDPPDFVLEWPERLQESFEVTEGIDPRAPEAALGEEREPGRPFRPDRVDHARSGRGPAMG